MFETRGRNLFLLLCSICWIGSSPLLARDLEDSVRDLITKNHRFRDLPIQVTVSGGTVTLRGCTC